MAAVAPYPTSYPHNYPTSHPHNYPTSHPHNYPTSHPHNYPTSHPHNFGRYPHPGPFPAFNQDPLFPELPVNHPPSPVNQYPRPEPFPTTNSRNDFPISNHTPFGQYPRARPLPSYRPEPNRHDPRLRQRNKHVAFSTPSGGYYPTSTYSTSPTLPQWARQSPRRSRRSWSRFLKRFRQKPTARAEASRPVNPTGRQSQPFASSREQQIQQLLSLLLPHVPTAEPLIRPLLNHIHDPQLLRQLIDTLKAPLTQQQFLEIQSSFAIPRDEQEEIIRALNNPNDPDIPAIQGQFKEFVEEISGRPVPAPDEVPTSTGGTISRLGRLIPSFLRNSLRGLRRKRSKSTPRRFSTEQQNEIERFPIHELRQSQFRRFIVESFACTECETIIPANRTRGADPQLGTNLHLRCPNRNCRAVFCRGCRRNVIGCQPNCNARHSCGIKSCCANVRAMAIFEYLSVFDEDYLTRVRNFHHGAADAHTNANRLSFLAHAFDPANRRDARFRGFISVLKRTLKYVCFWLEPSVPENVACPTVAQMLATSFLLEVVRAFLSRGIENLEQFRARGYLIHRIVDLLFTLNRKRSGPLYDLVRSTPVVIDQSPGLRRLIWASESVWEGHIPPGEDPAILKHMHSLWTRLEHDIGSGTLRGAANEFDARLYERAHDVSLSQHA